MAKLTGKEILSKAVEIVGKNPGGIRTRELVNAIQQQSPETPVGRIQFAVSYELPRKCKDTIAKPSRGLYIPQGEQVPELPEAVPNEKGFYDPFANWLKDDLEEVTTVAALGGTVTGKRWGTPDIVGVYKPRRGDVIQFDPEIVSAELKTNPTQPVEAFGQAVAYRLFSTKVYIVMPTTLTKDDQDRLEALCMLFGVGLVLFNPDDTQNPGFTIRMRAQRFMPDMFYVNEFADRLKQSKPEIFNQLF